MREELARLLGQLEGDTARVRGRFTFDPVVGLRRLAQDRFRQPESYLLALVQAAVAAGARRFELERHPLYACACWDGDSSRLEPLATCLRSLTAEHLLFWPMVGAAASGASRVLLQTRAQSQALLIEPGRLEMVELPSRRPELGWSHRLLLSFAAGRGFRKVPTELSVLRERCLFAPLRLSCNGSPLEPEVGKPGRSWPWKARPGVLLEWVYPGWGLYLPAVKGQLRELRPEGPGSARVALPPQGTRSYGAWLALESDLSPGLECRVVHQGVVVARTLLAARLGGLAVCSSEGMELEASGLRLVDQRWPATVTVFETELERLIERARGLGDSLPLSPAGRRRLQAEAGQ
ncbi:MAG: hypothetical protein AB7S38_35865 [Vulcanimicrobiota bacterium]